MVNPPRRFVVGSCRRFAFDFVAALGVSLLASVASAGQPAAPAARDSVLVGAASRSVLPLVDGSLAYLGAGFPGRHDALDPGIVVPAWDDGRIAVGNGDSVSYWVHDDVRVSAMAIDDPRSAEIVVLVASDLYMIFRNDAEEIRARAAALLPPGIARRTKIVVSASHNHHGPDTAFDVNHQWYEHMAKQAAAAVAEAVRSRRPATLRVASGQHWFGQKDGTDPQILDPRLQVLQAVGRHGNVIATAVQWNDHPEGTLSWGPPQDVIAADCALLGLSGSDCDAEGRYFTADYPGILRQDLQARYGGEVLYFNGALGVLIGPGGAHVWEVDDQHPLGNQLVAPSGATAPGGGSDYTQHNFRRTAIIGEQLAAAVVHLVDQAVAVTKPRISYDVQPFFMRLSNFGFRVLLVVDPDTGRTQLGHNPPPLYTCAAGLPPSMWTCASDDFASAADPLVGAEARIGDHLQSAVEYVRIGSIGMMFLPGEIPGELTIGLPAGFRSTPELWYDEAPGRHAFGDDYQTPGYVLHRMHDTYEWTIGLGSDQLGYVIPISNFRVFCVVDEFAGPGACELLHALGVIEFPDSIAGSTCKQISDDPSSLTLPEPFATLVRLSCRYGQAFGEADGHYEETNSASWDLAQSMLDAVGELTGDHCTDQVNPEFPGWWQGNLPPGDLP
jgi:hypothetical protein